MSYFYDENNIRYTLASTHEGKPLNWIFLPGGPGGDASYFKSLVELLNCPGNSWLIDLPGNGSHTVQKDNFDSWYDLFLPMIQQFENPILMGHSFGGMFPLMFPELEKLLKGFVILNSAPSLWLEEAAKVAAKRQLPDVSVPMGAFVANPTQETFDAALAACMPYYFPPETLNVGQRLLSSVPFAFQPAVWWQRKALEVDFSSCWIPTQVKTLIIGAEFDAIVPFSLFERDTRFDRANIEKVFIKGAGHLPWIEKPEEVKRAFKRFEASL